MFRVSADVDHYSRAAQSNERGTGKSPLAIVIASSNLECILLIYHCLCFGCTRFVLGKLGGRLVKERRVI